MRANVKAIFDQIDAILVKGDQDAADLWDILTGALRSSDENRDGQRKEETVMVTRTVLFPKFVAAETIFTRGSFFPAHAPAGSTIRDANPLSWDEVDGDHFEAHFLAAVEAIKRSDL